MRGAGGRATVGRKVGFANKAMWRSAQAGHAGLGAHVRRYRALCDSRPCVAPIGRMFSPKIEPEIVFKLKRPLAAGLDPAAALEGGRVARAGLRDHRLCVSGMAISRRPISLPPTGPRTQPSSSASRCRISASTIPVLVDRLPRFAARLLRDGELAEEGSGRNSLRSPALCLAELAAAVSRQAGAEPLDAGELISSGTLTTSLPISPGETWRVEVDGLDFSPLTLQVLG